VIAVPLSDTWTLTGGPMAGSMPITNLKDQQPSNPCRWIDLSQVYVVVDAGAAVTINLIELLYTNATVAATWRIRAAASQANLIAAPGYDSRVAGVDLQFFPDVAESWWDRIHSYLWLGATPKTFRWWRVDVFDAANPATYFQAGRLYMDNAYQASRGVKLGGDTVVMENVPTGSTASQHQQTAGGQKYPAVRAKTGGLHFGIEYLQQSEAYRQLYRIVRQRGATRDVHVIIDPDSRAFYMEQQAYGTLAVGPKFVWSTLSAVTGAPLISQDFSVEELP